MIPYDVFPPEIVFHLLSFLTWNDLLRFRRVSTRAKEITNAFIGSKKGRLLIPQVQIDETSSKSMASYLLIGFPAPRLYLNNWSPTNSLLETENESFSKFLSLHGHHVTHLKLKCMTLSNETERTFLNALLNLQELEVENLQVSPTLASIHRRSSNIPGFYHPEENYFPETFKNLKVVKLNVCSDNGFRHFEMLHAASAMRVSLMMFLSYPQLEHYAGAYYVNNFLRKMKDQKIAPFKMISKTVVSRESENQSSLKFYDFANYNWKNEKSSFCRLISGLFLKTNARFTKMKSKVEFMNVPATWFVEAYPLNIPKAAINGSSIVSLVNVHQSLFYMTFKNLKRIQITSTTLCALAPNWRIKRPPWRNLNVLDITVDSKVMGPCSLLDNERIQRVTPALASAEILDFFFDGIRRRNLVELRLAFEVPHESYICERELARCCPNLKKLTLNRWSSQTVFLSELWGKLTGLVEINLEYCRDLGNSAFIGFDANKPAFLNLTNLKKLSIKGSNTMPRINDDLFRFVFSKLRLTHLKIECKYPLINVTPAGILSLLNGPFAESIERFPFNGWFIAKVEKGEFKKMEKKFRSYRMI